MKRSKNTYIICFIILVSCFGYGQNKHTKQFKTILSEADILFDMDDFKNAEQKYLSIYNEDVGNEKLNLNIAICKYKLKEFPDSILPYLSKVDKSTFAEAQFYEAKIFHLEHKHLR